MATEDLLTKAAFNLCMLRGHDPYEPMRGYIKSGDKQRLRWEGARVELVKHNQRFDAMQLALEGM